MRHLIPFAMIGLIVHLACPAQCQEPAAPERATTSETAPEPFESPSSNPNPFSLVLGVDFASQYFFRGIVVEDQGLIAQPWLELGFLLYENDEGPLNSIAGHLETWNSFHSGPTGSTSVSGPVHSWYEADFAGGLTLGLLDRVEIGLKLWKYSSPNGSFADMTEFEVGLSFDDSGVWEALGIRLPGFAGLQPYANLMVELSGQSDGGADEGVYLELGIEPTLSLFESDALSLGLRLPVALGLSLGDYYENDSGQDQTFGFFEAGAVAELELGFIPPALGTWQLSLGARLLWLGDHTASYNAGSDFEVIGILGLNISF